MTLPECFHRKEEVPGGYVCHSNRILHFEGYATKEICLVCPYANRPNEEDEIDPLPLPPAFGPGTEIELIFDDIGVEKPKGCRCFDLKNRMNSWGVDGCRKNRESILFLINENYNLLSVKNKVISAFKIAAKARKYHINLFDPVGSIVDEAIRRAEENLKIKFVS